VSLGPNGRQGNRGSYSPTLSADGRFVAFYSEASSLVPDDTKGQADVFVHDRQTGTTERVSVGPGGVQGDANSSGGALSADGRFVAFSSFASNLVPGDSNGTEDVFVRDRRTGTITRVSLGPRRVQGNGSSDDPALSADGRFVAFYSVASNLVPSDLNGKGDVFVHDRQTSTTARVSLGPNGRQGNSDSAWPDLSANGRVVAFGSYASNLVPGDTNGGSEGEQDVFVRTLVGER
jgi:Tol biopolymer transport system component